MELAEGMGLKVSEKPFTMVDMYIADECFLTGTAAEVVPIIDIDTRKIGNGKPGPVTKKLIDAYREMVNTEGTEIY